MTSSSIPTTVRAEGQPAKKLREAMRKSLRAQQVNQRFLVREDVEAVARRWMTAAERDHGIAWQDFLPGNSPADACRAFAVEWMTEKRPRRAGRGRLRQMNAFLDTRTSAP